MTRPHLLWTGVQRDIRRRSARLQSACCSTRVWRAVQSTRIGATAETATRCRRNSRSVAPARWMSSTTTISGRSAAMSRAIDGRPEEFRDRELGLRQADDRRHPFDDPCRVVTCGLGREPSLSSAISGVVLLDRSRRPSRTTSPNGQKVIPSTVGQAAAGQHRRRRSMRRRELRGCSRDLPTPGSPTIVTRRQADVSRARWYAPSSSAHSARGRRAALSWRTPLVNVVKADDPVGGDPLGLALQLEAASSASTSTLSPDELVGPLADGLVLGAGCSSRAATLTARRRESGPAAPASVSPRPRRC